jgi:hypothetical protein
LKPERMRLKPPDEDAWVWPVPSPVLSTRWGVYG